MDDRGNYNSSPCTLYRRAKAIDMTHKACSSQNKEIDMIHKVCTSQIMIANDTITSLLQCNISCIIFGNILTFYMFLPNQMHYFTELVCYHTCRSIFAVRMTSSFIFLRKIGSPERVPIPILEQSTE